jgi:hypothetical protein
MSQVKLLSFAEMNNRVSALKASLLEIQTILQEKMGNSSAPVKAQSARLVAFALAKAAAPLVENIEGTLAFLSPPPAAETPEVATDDSLLGQLIQVATAIARDLAGQLDVAEEAIAPFLVETNSIMLVSAEEMINQARAKLAEADTFTA